LGALVILTSLLIPTVMVTIIVGIAGSAIAGAAALNPMAIITTASRRNIIVCYFSNERSRPCGQFHRMKMTISSPLPIILS